MQSTKQNGIAFCEEFLPKNDDAAYINNIQMPLGGRPRGICLFGLQQIVKEADILFLEREFPGLLLFTISTMRSLMGVGTPHLRPHSHTTPLIASISQGLPF